MTEELAVRGWTVSVEGRVPRLDWQDRIRAAASSSPICEECLRPLDPADPDTISVVVAGETDLFCSWACLLIDAASLVSVGSDEGFPPAISVEYRWGPPRALFGLSEEGS